MTFSLWLLACGGDEPSKRPGDPGAEATSESSSPWTVPGETEPPPFDADALARGLQQAIGLALEIDARPVIDAYDEMMGHASAGCPDAYGSGYTSSYGSSTAWYSQCEAASGAVYSGYASDYRSNDYDGSGQGYRGLYAEASIVAPEGTLWSGTGYWAHGEYRYSGVVDEYIELDGAIEYSRAEGDWLADGIVPAISIHRIRAVAGGWGLIELDGSVTGLDGPVDTVSFTEVSLDGRDGCADPSGQLAVRTSEADWFELEFSGSCDGCAEARWRGQPMGELCADFTPWTTGGSR